jgi:hypothetical protein
MNAWMKRATNSENLGARIMWNGVLNEKIWALEAWRAKMVFLEGSGVILEFFEWLEGLGAKDRGSCEFWGFFRDFVEFWEGLEWFRTYL